MALPTTPAAPAAPAAPSPAPAPAAAPSQPSAPSGQSNPDEDINGSLEAFDKAFDARAGAKPPDKPADKPAEAAKPPETAPEKPDAPPAADTPTDDKDGRRITPKWYREQIEKTTGALKTAQESLAAAEARIAAAESRGKDTTVLTERLAAAEKARDEAMANLRAAKQEVSPEFKDKFDKPFNDAADLAKSEIEQLAVINPDTGETVRAASWEKDFAGLYNLPYTDAKARAKALFGEDYGVAMEHYNALHRLNRTREAALKEEQTKWQERTQAEETSKIKQREAFQAIAGKVDADVKGRYEFLQEDPKDPAWNTDLKAGYELFSRKPENFAEAAALRSMTRHFAAAARPLAEKVKRQAAELTRLQGVIDQLKSAGPGPTKHPGGGAENKPYVSIIDEAREALKG